MCGGILTRIATKFSLEFRQTIIVEPYRTSRQKREEQLADKHCKCSDIYLNLFGLETGFGNLERACSHDKVPCKAQAPTSQEQHRFSLSFKGLNPSPEPRWCKMCLTCKYYSLALRIKVFGKYEIGVRYKCFVNLSDCFS